MNFEKDISFYLEGLLWVLERLICYGIKSSFNKKNESVSKLGLELHYKCTILYNSITLFWV